MSFVLPVSIKDVMERIDAACGKPVLTVGDPNALTQVVGWLKFRSKSGMVLLRGQSRMYPDMVPSGFRSSSGNPLLSIAARGHLSESLRTYTAVLTGGPCVCPGGPYNYGQSHHCREQVTRLKGKHTPIVQGTYRAAVEPLLQHYGTRTRWLDVVDNVWIALWFACHTQTSTGRHAFHLRRSPAQESDEAMAYIAVMEAGPVQPTGIPGYWIGSSVRVIDLRYAVPSVYLRPHAQHGLLVAPAKLWSRESSSMLPSVVAYLEIRLVDALDWLGHGAMTSPHTLFPPAARDEGYRRLLDSSAAAPDVLGPITVYGPGY